LLDFESHQHCERSWSRWFNTHHPEPYWNSGDNESISYIQDTYHSICGSQSSTITGVECVCAGSGEDWKTAGDVMVSGKPSTKLPLDDVTHEFVD